MDELVAKVAAVTGIDAAKARSAIGIILGYLKREGPPAETRALLAKLPGAEEAAAAAPVGGIFGGGIFAVFNSLSGLGLGITQIQSLAKTLLAFAEERAGKAAVQAVIGRISGLQQFV
jgi:hypothetical protein